MSKTGGGNKWRKARRRLGREILSSGSAYESYEVKVKVGNNGNAIIKKYHIDDANSPSTAAKRVEKYGIILSVKKLHATDLVEQFEYRMNKDIVYTKKIAPDSPVAMDEIIFRNQ